jgi:peptidoglycan/xylan/chitin deacetylase (PgdA/CDA1 family)
VAVKHALLRAFGIVRRLERRDGNAVLLTFDDGPHPEVTEGVLDRLQRYGARAVFFLVGNRIPRAPSVIPKILAAGHVLGNHGFAHKKGRGPWLWPYLKDLKRCQQAIGEAAGQAPRLFRPPEGRISPASLLAPRFLGLRTVYWSIDSADWKLRHPEDALRCGEGLSRAVSSGDIILLHDDNPCVLPLLDVLLPVLAAKKWDLRGARSIFCTARGGERAHRDTPSAISVGRG